MDLRNKIKEVLDCYKSEVDNFNDAVFTEKFDAVANDLNDLFNLHKPKPPLNRIIKTNSPNIINR